MVDYGGKQARTQNIAPLPRSSFSEHGELKVLLVLHRHGDRYGRHPRVQRMR